MRLVLMRHAEAEPLRSFDSERALTLRGHRQAYETGEWLSTKVSRHCILVCSPYCRARETAAELQLVMPQLSIHVAAQITPEDTVRQALSGLEAIASEGEMIVVSHMPLVASIAGWLEHGVMSAGQAFSLAEARLYELELLGAGQARLIDRFVPMS